MKILLIDNCNFAVDLAKEPLHFKMTGIGGPDILEGNKTLTLGLVWQIMRAYTLSILQKLAKSTTPIADKDIINWANNKVKYEWIFVSKYFSFIFQLKSANKKTFLTNFQDQSLSDSMLICDLIDAIKPGSIQYNLLKTSGTAEVNKQIFISIKHFFNLILG
jgi:plastin-3